MLKMILKQVAALAIGGALTAGASVAIDPAHLSESLLTLGKLALSGAVAALITLNIRAPKDDG